jgi:hypothetical protein
MRFEATTVLPYVTAMPVSPALKPEPVRVTELPAGPLVRLMDMPGVTVKVIFVTLAAAVTEPCASMLCAPEAEAGTVKVVPQSPRVSAVIPWTTAVPS